MKSETLYEIIGEIPEMYLRGGSAPRRRHPLRWLAAAACLVLLAIPAVRLWRTAAPRTYTARLDGGETVVYRRGGAAESSIVLDFPHTDRALTEEELSLLFPRVAARSEASGTFDTRSGRLVRLEGRLGEARVTAAADGVPFSDVILAGGEAASILRGVPVTAGFFRTEPDSRGERTVVFFAGFSLGGVRLRLELAGPEREAARLCGMLSALADAVIAGGAPALSAVTRPLSE